MLGLLLLLFLGQVVDVLPDSLPIDTALTDIVSGVTDGTVETLPIIDSMADWSIADTPSDLATTIQDWLSTQAETVPQPAITFLQEVTDPVLDAVNNGIVPPGLAVRFYYWLYHTEGVTTVPVTGTYAYVQGYVMKWAQENGWATMGPNPVAVPTAVTQAQQVVQSEVVPPPTTGTAPPAPTAVAPAPAPLPVTSVPPPVLPTPTPGRVATATAATGITGGTVTGGGAPDVSAAEVSAALGTLATEIVELQAKVLDDMLPGMAPGQVPEALHQLNAAVNSLEYQMSLVRQGTWPRGFVGLQEAVGGALQALHGLAQAVNELHDQMAEKADSALEDGLNATQVEIETLGGTVGLLAGTTIPALANRVGTVESGLGALDNTVTGTVQPELAATRQATDNLTTELSGTDKECLDKLCDAEGNVTDPIQQGGATPSLLKQLGSLLSKALEIGALATILDGLLTILDARAAVSAVVKDTEVIAAWATSAANVIETDLSWQGQL